MDADRGEEGRKLSRRVDELAKHLSEKRGDNAVKKVEDLDKYLIEMAEKDEFAAEGEQQISGALQPFVS